MQILTGHGNFIMLLSESIRIKDILGNVGFAELEHIIKEEKKRVSKFPAEYSIWTST